MGETAGPGRYTVQQAGHRWIGETTPVVIVVPLAGRLEVS